MKVQVYDIEKLKLDEKNLRLHDVESLEAIKRSLMQFGQYKPIIVQKSTMKVLAGNGTVQAAKELGWKEISINIVDINDEQSLKLSLADNRTAELGFWDINLLSEIFMQMERENQIVTGFTDEEITSIVSDMDTTELEMKPKKEKEKIYIQCGKCGYKFVREDGILAGQINFDEKDEDKKDE